MHQLKPDIAMQHHTHSKATLFYLIKLLGLAFTACQTVPPGRASFLHLTRSLVEFHVHA